MSAYALFPNRPLPLQKKQNVASRVHPVSTKSKVLSSEEQENIYPSHKRFTPISISSLRAITPQTDKTDTGIEVQPTATRESPKFESLKDSFLFLNPVTSSSSTGFVHELFKQTDKDRKLRLFPKYYRFLRRRKPRFIASLFSIGENDVVDTVDFYKSEKRYEPDISNLEVEDDDSFSECDAFVCRYKFSVGNVNSVFLFR